MARYQEKKGEIKAVITDMMMPSMDGTELVRAIRAIDPDVKIIAMSGLLGEKDSPETAGIDEFLVKPFTTERLLQTLRTVLDFREALRRKRHAHVGGGAPRAVAPRPGRRRARRRPGRMSQAQVGAEHLLHLFDEIELGHLVLVDELHRPDLQLHALRELRRLEVRPP